MMTIMRTKESDLREQYISSLTPEESSLKGQSRLAAEELGLAGISISKNEAQLIKTLVAAHGGQKFIEIGTLTGLSAQYLFDALPASGQLWTLEKSPEHAAKAREILEQVSQNSKKIHLLEGDAREILKSLSSEGPFDGIFIDGNKAAYFDYLVWSEENLKSGGLIVADNVFLSGSVWGESTIQKFSEKQIRIMREFNQRLMDSNLFTSCFVPTTEGLLIAIKK